MTSPTASAAPSPAPRMGIAGRVSAYFLSAHLTPLLALLGLLLGVFAVIVTPREEEPQIDVTMANVIVPFLGAAVADVESLVTVPAEQVLSQMSGVEHVMSVSQPGMAVVTVQFKVGVKRNDALVRLYDTVGANADWLPRGLGVLPPIIKPKGIDDVPIVTLTLHSTRAGSSVQELARVAHSLEAELKRAKGTREVKTLGAPDRAVRVQVDPARLTAAGLTLIELQQALQSANAGMPVGELIRANQSVELHAGSHFHSAEDVAELVVGTRAGKPLFLKDLAQISDGAIRPSRTVWTSTGPGSLPADTKAEADKEQSQGALITATGQVHAAVTLAVTKKAGENAIAVADAVMQRVDELRNTLIPEDVQLTVTRNYGETANDKAMKLIQKLLFATASVVALVFLTLGRREAAIVGAAVILTLTTTLFASWVWGFTLNRVSLFALIFSIGILVDDAIVVVENIHRHRQLDPHTPFAQLIPRAVDEVGGPTILATFTVIAALLPMAFVSGLMGPYMSPIPINASLGMLLSLAIAFVVTPWLSRLWMKSHAEGTRPSEGTRHAEGPTPTASAPHTAHSQPSPSRWQQRQAQFFDRLLRPFLDPHSGSRRRRGLALVIAALIALSLLLPAMGWVVLKMLPFDNKSEFQVVVDMPLGTPLEKTAALMQELNAHLLTVPEVLNVQGYAGTASPINFNGLVRQYDLRTRSHMGDLQVNLVNKHARKLQSHDIATRERPALQALARPYGARIKVVEVPPGPPVLAPLVAEIYGPNEDARLALARQVQALFARTEGVVDTDDSTVAAAPRKQLLVDRRKAALLGVAPAQIVETLRMGQSGSEATYLHNQSRYAVPTLLQLPERSQGELETLLQLPVRSESGQLVPVRELVTVSESLREQPRYRKDLLPVSYVTGDTAGQVDSPLYGLFQMRGELAKLRAPDGGPIEEAFVSAPSDPYHAYTLKWDGEWQITYETFRDMGLAYAVGLVLIYLLVVAQFGSYGLPLVIMAPIPLTLIGVMPGHALLGAQFTATSMIGMIALAGIIVRNSILLVDFIQLQMREGAALADAIVAAATARAQPIVLTALAAMMGALFILDDPIFNGLAISLIFGILVSTLLTLLVIPLLYGSLYRRSAPPGTLPNASANPSPNAL